MNSPKALKIQKLEYSFHSLLTMPPEPNDEVPLAVTERYILLNKCSVFLMLIVSLLCSGFMDRALTATQPDYHCSNADAHPGTFRTSHHASHSGLHVCAEEDPEESASQCPGLFSSLKRDADTFCQVAEFLSKCVTTEPIEISLWNSNIPGLNSQQSQPIVLIGGKRNVDRGHLLPSVRITLTLSYFKSDSGETRSPTAHHDQG